MCKMHGVRFIKGIKIFESVLKKQNVATVPKKLKFWHVLLSCELKLLISVVIRNLGKSWLSLIVCFAK